MNQSKLTTQQKRMLDGIIQIEGYIEENVFKSEDISIALLHIEEAMTEGNAYHKEKMLELTTAINDHDAYAARVAMRKIKGLSGIV